MSSTAAFLSACSTYALARDFKASLREALPDVVCRPESDNLYLWHGNVRSHEGYLDGTTVHFLLIFPKTYPQQPPEVRLFQHIPHPNVRSATAVAVHGCTVPRQARWRLALWDCVPDTSTWSGAYTVSSILVQLQAFLLIEDMEDFIKEGAAAMGAVIGECSRFACPCCSHKPGSPYPAFPTEEHMAHTLAVASQAKKLVTKPVVPPRTPEALAQLQLHQQGQQRTTTSAPAALKPAATPAAAAAAAASTAAKAAKPVAPPAEPSEVWTVVERKKGADSKSASKHHASAASTSAAGISSLDTAQVLVPTAAGAPATAGVSYNNKFSALVDVPEPAVLGTTHNNTSAVAVNEPTTSDVAHAHPAPVMTAAAKKNLARKLKRQQQKAQSAGAADPALAQATPSTPTPVASPTGLKSAAPSGSPTSHIAASPSSITSSSVGGSDAGWMETPSKSHKSDKDAACDGGASAASLKEQVAAVAGREHSELIDGILQEWHQQVQLYQQRQQPVLNTTAADVSAAAAAAAAALDQSDLLTDLQQPMGLLGALARDDLIAVMCQLRPRDIASLACTCKGLRAASKDGALWQTLMRTQFPGAAITASRMSDWQHAYCLEASHVLDDLKCFYMRVNFEEDVLCLPLNFTINPRTNCVDYIEASPEFISLSAFTGGVTKTSTQETIKAVLPLYITAEHFARAQTYYPRVLRALAPEAIAPGGGAPPATVWLEILPKILNTAVVLLCDHGHAASHKALLIYVAVHRLLLAMCEKHNLWGAVRHKLDTFLRCPDKRSKEHCPNLGLLLPLLSLSPTHHWKQVAVPLLEEALARGVMWMCKAKPSLEKRFTAPRTSASEVDTELLEGSWEGSRVSTRLMLFHHAFMCIVAAPPGCSLEAVMDGADALYGHPGNALAARFLCAMNRILTVENWQQYFGMLGMQMTEPGITAALKAAWARSCKRGYTRKGMDYSKIQASGVSKILLKGQSYTAPPGMARMELKDVWKWKASSGCRILDASILLYYHDTKTKTRTFVEVVDWCHTYSHTIAGAVVHSGDMFDNNEHTGTHTAQVNLKKLGATVNELFVVVSAWAGAKLSDIVQPFVQVCDPATGMSLCEYHLEDQPQSVRQAKSSVIMARIYQDGKAWKVQALGIVGMGYASHAHYEPIKASIAEGKF